MLPYGVVGRVVVDRGEEEAEAVFELGYIDLTMSFEKNPELNLCV